MSEAKHTLGPWNTCRTVRGGDGAHHTDIHAAKGEIEHAFWVAHLNTYQVPTSEMEANARLIAAAPQLLACVENLLERLKIALDIDGRPMDIYDRAAIEAAEDALKKAEGK